MPSAPELREAIATYQRLIANYSLTRDRLIAQIAAARNSAELEHRLDANARAIASLGHAIEVARERLRLRENGEGEGAQTVPSYTTGAKTR